MITDDMLREAASEYALFINENLPQEEEIDHEFSKRFTKKMNKLLYRAKHPVWYQTKRIAVCILLTLFFLFGSVMTFNQEARAYIWGWLSRKGDGYYEFYYEGNEVTEETVTYEPQWMPEQYTYEKTMDIEGGKIYIFLDAEGLIAQFMYSSNQDALRMFMVAEDYIEQTCDINGIKGTLYLSPDDTESSALVWINQESGTIFIVSAHVEPEILIKIAENILKNK